VINQVHIDRIDQRRRYLEKRIEAKRSVGWETIYDESEHAALAWALEQLRAPVNTLEFVGVGGGVIGHTVLHPPTAAAVVDQAAVAFDHANANRQPPIAFTINGGVPGAKFAG
jgi:hypothetical protein